MWHGTEGVTTNTSVRTSDCNKAQGLHIAVTFHNGPPCYRAKVCKCNISTEYNWNYLDIHISRVRNVKFVTVRDTVSYIYQLSGIQWVLTVIRPPSPLSFFMISRRSLVQFVPIKYIYLSGPSPRREAFKQACVCVNENGTSVYCAERPEHSEPTLVS